MLFSNLLGSDESQCVKSDESKFLLVKLRTVHSRLRIPVIVSSDSGRNVSTDSGAS